MKAQGLFQTFYSHWTSATPKTRTSMIATIHDTKRAGSEIRHSGSVTLHSEPSATETDVDRDIAIDRQDIHRSPWTLAPGDQVNPP